MGKIQIGSVSTGTLRNEDLIPAFAAELHHVTNGRMTRDETMIFDEASNFDFDSEDTSYLVEELMGNLDYHAPPHMRFGAHEGDVGLESDGADFGWWPVDFDMCQAAFISEGKNGAHTFVDTECGLFVEVNDHGNMTVRELGGDVIWDAV
jgi:hypothetical protein